MNWRSDYMYVHHTLIGSSALKSAVSYNKHKSLPVQLKNTQTPCK